MAAAQPGPRYSGWWQDPTQPTQIAFYAKGTKVGHMTTSAFVPAKIVQATGGVEAVTGNLIATAGDARITVGNVRLGVVSAFATTEPTSAVVMKAGTAAAGAITTSSGIFASATVCRKIIADGTVSNVET